jgi:hypothetical protein
MLLTYLVGNYPQGAYNQDNNHQKASYKSRMFHPGHPKSKKQQNASYIIKQRIRIMALQKHSMKHPNSMFTVIDELKEL